MSSKPILAARDVKGERRPVSEINAERALANIHRKIEVMEAWIGTSIPFLTDADGIIELNSAGQKRLDFFPKTLRQFNRWESATNCVLVAQQLPELHRNANDTLRKHEILRRSVEQLVVELSRKAEQQLQDARPQRVAKLHRELHVAEGRQARLETALVEHRRLLKESEHEIRSLSVRIQRISEESHRAIITLQNEVEELNRERAQLLHQLKKVVPFKRVRKIEK